jgi:hypothetical protein
MEAPQEAALAAPVGPTVATSSTAPYEPNPGGCPVGAACVRTPAPDGVYAAAFQAAFPYAPQPRVSLFVDIRTKQRYQALIVGTTGKGTSITLFARYVLHAANRTTTGWSFTGSERAAAGMYFPGSCNYDAEVVLVTRAGTALPTSSAAKLAHAVIRHLADGTEHCGRGGDMGTSFACKQPAVESAAGGRSSIGQSHSVASMASSVAHCVR